MNDEIVVDVLGVTATGAPRPLPPLALLLLLPLLDPESLRSTVFDDVTVTVDDVIEDKRPLTDQTETDQFNKSVGFFNARQN